MNHPPEAVELLARALWDEVYPPLVHPGDMWQERIKATALLDRIAPHYLEQAARIAEVESQSNNPYISGLAMRIAAAIRNGE